MTHDINIRVEVDDHYERAEVFGTLPSGREVSVPVYGPRRKFGQNSPAEVNWSALGSVSAETAEAYAALIAKAAEVARERNEEAGL